MNVVARPPFSEPDVKFDAIQFRNFKNDLDEVGDEPRLLGIVSSMSSLSDDRKGALQIRRCPKDAMLRERCQSSMRTVPFKSEWYDPFLTSDRTSFDHIVVCGTHGGVIGGKK